MEETKTHWRTLVNQLYIGAYSLKPKEERVVKIISIAKEIVKGEGGKSEPCTVAQLENEKPFILNRTNQKTITAIYKSPYIEDWVGKYITIYATTTKVAGETVECLRIKNIIPTTPNTSDYSKQIQMVKNCSTLAELKALYDTFTTDEKAACLTIKDEMKGKLK